LSSFSKKVLHKLADELDEYLDEDSQEDPNDSNYNEYEEDSFEDQDDYQEQPQNLKTDSRKANEPRDSRALRDQGI